ncbi:hypothetical protein OPHB3_3005 [Oceanobacillus picturae]|uniref:Uncharacterized protein n=2 Tax=Oceanobacillus picturae TaxID=171693 RepID=A0A0U9HGW9_9BACI|nr:hypothetical protein OPHB3_3005 [Oceanobacillus picturae]
MGLQHMTFLGQQISERQLTPNTLVNGLICKLCNNGWMSLIESDVKALLLALLKQPTTNLSTLLKEDHLVLAKWTFKTAIILNHASNYRNIVPRRHFRHFYQHKRIPENVTVLMGFTKETEKIDWVQSQGVMHTGDASISSNPRFEDIYKITIQLDHLLLKVIYSPFYEYNYVFDQDDHVMIHPNLWAPNSFKIAENFHSFDIKGSLYST